MLVFNSILNEGVGSHLSKHWKTYAKIGSAVGGAYAAKQGLDYALLTPTQRKEVRKAIHTKLRTDAQRKAAKLTAHAKAKTQEI